MITQRLSSTFADAFDYDMVPEAFGISTPPTYFWTGKSLSVADVPIQSMREIVSNSALPLYATDPSFGPGLVGASGLRSLDLDGVDDYLRTDQFPTTCGSLVIAARLDPSADMAAVFNPFVMFNNQNQSAPTDDGLLGLSTTGEAYLNPVGTDQVIRSTRTYNPGDWMLLCYSSPAGSPARFMANGEALPHDVVRDFYGYNRIYVGHGGTPARRLHGQVAFVAAFQQHLTFTEMATLTRTIKDRYPTHFASVGPIWGE